jgi:type II secretory pathway pseudopilin PulG
MDENPYESPETSNKSLPPKPAGCQFTLLQLLAVIGIIGLLLGLLLPARRSAGEAARRTECINKLKQVTLALQSYADTNGNQFPPAYTVDAAGKPLHSWRTLILPYLEQKQLYASIDLSKPWDDPANKAALAAIVDTYRCPNFHGPANHTAYLAVVIDGSCLRPAQPRDFADISDGTSDTILIIEVDSEHAVPWMSPQDADEATLAALSNDKTRPHSVILASNADGSVRSISKDVPPPVLRALTTIAGDDNALAKQAE